MKVAKTTVAPRSALRLLHEHIRYEEPARPITNFHASDITDQQEQFCPREPVLYVKHKIAPPVRKITTAEAVTFEWGRMTETRVRQWFADMGRAVGDWKCDHRPCGRVYAWRTRPEVCGDCQGERFRYLERRAISAISGISCGLDLLVNVDRPKLRIFEVKSIDKDKFKELAAPLGEHRLRTQLYLRCSAESEDPMLAKVDVNEAGLIYVSKGGYGSVTPEMLEWPIRDGKFSPFKVYTIKRDDAALDKMVASVVSAREGLKGGPLPERICGAVGSPRAQKCKAAGHCFK